jgi:hypothetical protein
MTGATQRETETLLQDYAKDKWTDQWFSFAQILLLQLLPARWLTPEQRCAQRAVKEMLHYQVLMKQVFIALHLCQKVGRGHGENRTYTYNHVKFGYREMLYRQEFSEAAENTYRWRIDAFPVGVRMSRFLEAQVERNLQLALGCPVRVLETDRVWIVVNPCDEGKPKAQEGKLPKMVAMKAMTPPSGERGLWLPIGVDGFGNEVWHNLASEGFPHLLVGGATGSGKSNALNCYLVSLCSRHTPEQLRLWLVDLKRVELADYLSLPHTVRVAKEEEDVAPLLDALKAEMERRFKALEEEHARHVDKLQDPPPHLVLVVDELATVTLGVEGKENALRLERLAQLGRSAGIHVILATQRPSIDVCPGPLKNNVPARVGLAMATMADSRVILDQNGAEELTPPGQAILVRGVETLKVMTPYLPDDERAQRLNALRSGHIELTDTEKLVLEAAKRIMREGKKVTCHAIHDQVRGHMGYNKVVPLVGSLRRRGLLDGNSSMMSGLSSDDDD